MTRVVARRRTQPPSPVAASFDPATLLAFAEAVADERRQAFLLAADNTHAGWVSLRAGAFSGGPFVITVQSLILALDGDRDDAADAIAKVRRESVAVTQCARTSPRWKKLDWYGRSHPV